MNKEQAIEIIETHSENILSDSLVGRALDMAIDALKAQLSPQGTTFDLISKTEVVKHLRRMLESTVSNTDYDEGFIDGVEFGISIVSTMPTIQPEPSIPLTWIGEQIERLRGMDNAFATLIAMQISGMLKKWRDEQDESN